MGRVLLARAAVFVQLIADNVRRPLFAVMGYVTRVLAKLVIRVLTAGLVLPREEVLVLMEVVMEVKPARVAQLIVELVAIRLNVQMEFVEEEKIVEVVLKTVGLAVLAVVTVLAT